jgi:DNA polymerase V
MSVVGARTARELCGEPCLELELRVDPKKGVTVSRSFGQRITELPELSQALASYVARAAEKLRREKLLARHMLVFMHTSPFAKDAAKDPHYAPSLSFGLPLHTNYTPELVHYALWALGKMYKPGYRYMKCGVMLTDLLLEGTETGDLFARDGAAIEADGGVGPGQPNHGQADSVLRERRHPARMDGRFRAQVAGLYDGLG